MRRLDLGDFCKECLCAECGNRKDCEIMGESTDWCCHNECKGKSIIITQCGCFGTIPLEEGEAEHEQS